MSLDPTGGNALGLLQPATAPSGLRRSLAPPHGVRRWRIEWPTTLAILVVHLASLLALLPGVFSVSGAVLCLAGLYAFGTLGINLGYHRLLTHRGFACPRWVERFLTLLAACNMQGSSASWVAGHRLHHQHSDHQPDPHSPLVDFLWSHMGWLFVRQPIVNAPDGLGRYAGDLCRDPFHWALAYRQRWVWVWLAHAAAFFAAGFGLGWAIQGDAAAGLRLGESWLVWGVAARMVIVWHITWAINSVTHIWGYRSHATSDNSRNNWLLGYLGMGEGWHNNHHADQRCAAHGRRWWEVDVTYLTILLMERVGLAWDVIRPGRRETARAAQVAPVPVPPTVRAEMPAA